ncbi:hypothetical protein L596_025015 [Steinernema carpocapsae]|uniref:Uncharacterized protein n=1 Tax=Steinernema carpocapsae TaxID=34508 RepID=A0A4V5ZYP1_STECR|nr:hypothetical protein L596_025015 [Steinernema carpocapsae]
MAQMHWARQAYLCSAFAYPMGYMLVHAIRDDVKFSKFYVNRLAQSPSDNLSELFESELFKANIKGSANVKLTLTDELEPQTYGSFLISPGAEIQLPLRMAFGDVEGARELGKGLELDMGIPSSRRKVDMNTHLADEMVTRMVLSKQAKEFAIQRELIRAQSGTMLFCQPAMWAGIIGGLYSVVALTAPILGPIISCAGAFVGAVGVFIQINKKYKEHKVIQLDKKTIEFDLSYVEGARDYLKSSMRLGRYLRKVLGEDAAKSFAENGDCMKQPARYSTRLAEIESYLHEKEGTPLRRRRVKVKEAQVEDELESD